MARLVTGSRVTRIVFFGSGEFAVPVLEALARTTPVEELTVVTTPARPAGRQMRLAPTPVAVRAGDLGLPVLAPERLRDRAAQLAIADIDPEVLVLADYGRIVPGSILAIPRHGALNLHPSLLPRHRGATPIPAAILAGDRETGVTLFRMDEGLDTGPIVAQVVVPLRGDETAPELEARLATLAAHLLLERLPAWLGGTLAGRPQPSEGVSLTRPLRRDDGRLDPSASPVLLARQVRACQPWPGTFLETDAGRLIVWRANAVPGDGPDETGGPRLVRSGSGVALVGPTGRLELLEVQAAGGRRMAGADWARGVRTLPAVTQQLRNGPSDGSALG
jgi:methionyl-tRNA formyltransferase